MALPDGLEKSAQLPFCSTAFAKEVSSHGRHI
jgi:hypothetical protein